jgi:nitrate/nitrite transporter NarK
MRYKIIIIFFCIVVFTVSTKEISLQNNTSKKLIQIPCGKFKNMRFDIDDAYLICSGIISVLGALGAACLPLALAFDR